MKKFLAIILAVLMVFSLVACGNETSIDTKNETDTGNTNIEDRTLDEILTYYNGYFGSSDVGFAGETITAQSNGMDIVIATTESGEGLFSMGILGNKMEIYKDKTGNQYVHMITKEMPATDETEAVEAMDVWYKYVPSKESTSEDNDIFSSMSSDFDTNELSVNQEDIKKVEYVETKDGVDYIKVTQIIKDESTGETTEEIWDFGINASTHKITTISQTIDDVVQTVTFSVSEKINVKIPEKIDECNEEDVAGMYMMLVFSAMGQETKE